LPFILQNSCDEQIKAYAKRVRSVKYKVAGSDLGRYNNVSCE